MDKRDEFLRRRKKILEDKDENLRREEEIGSNDTSYDNSQNVNQDSLADKNQVDEDQADENQVDKDQADENQVDKDQVDKDQVDKDQADENQANKDQADENQANKDQENKDQENKDQVDEFSKDSNSRKNINPDRKANNDTESASSGLKEKALESLADKVTPQNETVNKINNITQKAISIGKSVLNSGGVLAKLIVNPIFWIVIGVIILIIALSSAVAVIGGNDYNQSCDYNGVGSVNVADDADDFTRQSAIASWLMSTPFKGLGNKPMSKEQAIGIIGNLIQESYGANPKAMQGMGTADAWKSCGNDCVIGISGGGKAFGILQWDGGRRTNLAKFAKEKGTEWHDLTTQLEFLKSELDGAEKSSLGRGFSTPGKSIADYTIHWSNDVERCGRCHNESRVAYAEEFGKKFTGGVVSTPTTSDSDEDKDEEKDEDKEENEETSAPVSVGSLSTQCVTSGGSIDTSSVTQLAVSLAWTREDRRSGEVGYGVCPDGSADCGKSFSKPSYIEAKKLAQEKTSADPDPGLLASCDRFVATVIRLSGIDEKFPWGATRQQLDYVESSPDWSRISCQDRKPGDVLVRDGHIMLYIGEVDGIDSLASASIAFSGRVGPGGKGRSAHIGGVSCVGELFNADDAPTQGYRKGGS